MKSVSRLAMGTNTVTAGYDGRLLWFGDSSISPWYTAAASSLNLFGTDIQLDFQYHPGTVIAHPVNRFSISYSKLPSVFESLSEPGNVIPQQVLASLPIDTMLETKIRTRAHMDETMRRLQGKVHQVMADTSSFPAWLDSLDLYQSSIKDLRSQISTFDKQWASVLQSYREVVTKKNQLLQKMDTIPAVSAADSLRVQRLWVDWKKKVEHVHIGSFTVQHHPLSALRGRLQGVSIGGAINETEATLFSGITDPFTGLGLTDSLLPEYFTIGGSLNRDNYYIEGVRYTNRAETFSNTVVSSGWSHTIGKHHVSMQVGYATVSKDISGITPGEYDDEKADSTQHLAITVQASGTAWNDVVAYNLSLDHIGNDYVNLGDPFLWQGSSGYEGSAAIGLFKKRIELGLISRQRSMLGKQVLSNNGITVAGKFEKLPLLSLSLYPLVINQSTGQAQFDLQLRHTIPVGDALLLLALSGMSNTLLMQAPMVAPRPLHTRMVQAATSLVSEDKWQIGITGNYYIQVNGQPADLWETQGDVRITGGKGQLSSGIQLIREDARWSMGYRCELSYVPGKHTTVRAGFQQIARNQLFMDWQNQNHYATFAVSTTF